MQVVGGSPEFLPVAFEQRWCDAESKVIKK